VSSGVRGWGDFFAGRHTPEVSAVVDDTLPFMILDDARGAGPAFLLSRPSRIFLANTLDQVKPCLTALRQALQDGQIVAGYLGYEAGAAFEPRLAACLPLSDRQPLAWFGAFDAIAKAPSARTLLPPAVPLSGELALGWSEPEHKRATEAILSFIRAGDIYQANLTFQASLTMTAAPGSHYAALRDRQAAGWGAVLFTGQEWQLSLSPELFFTLEDGELQGRPMKGTATRGEDRRADQMAIETLRSCPKERAENLMIVDLIRNDFSRISEHGTVCVPELYSVETYPTVHQMTSRVTSRLKPGCDAIDVIEACFPCGSVTGAPKLRAMEIIAHTETRPRGSYTGSMGIMMPDGSAAFNVMIRTLSCSKGSNHAVVNVGSGITDGSRTEMEWNECLAKLAFTGSVAKIRQLTKLGLEQRLDPIGGRIQMAACPS
jgi:aminodeoxychorismate synthase component I